MAAVRVGQFFGGGVEVEAERRIVTETTLRCPECGASFPAAIPPDE